MSYHLQVINIVLKVVCFFGRFLLLVKVLYLRKHMGEKELDSMIELITVDTQTNIMPYPSTLFLVGTKSQTKY